MWFMLSEDYAAADVVVSAIEFVTAVLLMAGVYQGDTAIIICSCQQVPLRRGSQLIDFC